MLCPNCLVEISDNAKFCNNCGIPMPEQDKQPKKPKQKLKNFCINCGHENREGAKFCLLCGAPMSIPAQPEPAQPEPAQPELAQPEPAQPELAQPEPAQPELAQPEPAQPELAQPEPAQSEPAHPEPTQPEPTKPESVQPVRTEPVQAARPELGQPAQPAQVQQAQVQQEQKPKRRRKGLMIGLVSAGAVLVAAAVVLVLVLTGGVPVAGQWVSDDGAVIMVFDEEDGVEIYRLSGMQDTTYEYDQLSGAGSVDGNGFEVDEDEMDYFSDGGGVYMMRTEDELDIEAMMLSQLSGLYTCEETATVIVIDSDGYVRKTDLEGDTEGELTYNVEKGQGELTLKSRQYVFDGKVDVVDLGELGQFRPGDDALNVAAFVKKYGNVVLGTWYDEAGIMGTLAFTEDGDIEKVTYGTKTEGSYTFEWKQKIGDVEIDGTDAQSYEIKNGKLYWGDVIYTTTQTKQNDESNIYDALVGLWHDVSGNTDSFEFFDDGKMKMIYGGYEVECELEYDPVSMEGKVLMKFSEDYEAELKMEGEKLIVDDVEFGREFPTYPEGSIEGYWYSGQKHPGFIRFFDDGTVESYPYMYDDLDMVDKGTYLFNKSKGTGTVTLTVINTFDVDIQMVRDVLYFAGKPYTRDGISLIEGRWVLEDDKTLTIAFNRDGTMVFDMSNSKMGGIFTFSPQVGFGELMYHVDSEEVWLGFWIEEENVLVFNDGSRFIKVE